MMSRITRIFIALLMFVVVVPLTCALVGRFYQVSRACIVDGADAVDWLPPIARDVYCRGTGAHRVFEFTITEVGFREWARSINVAVSEIRQELAFERYLFWDRDAPPEAQTHAQLKAGLVGSRRHRNFGGYDIAYDRESSRAYAIWASH